MRQPAEERVRYLGELRRTLRRVVVPELSSGRALDAVELIENTLVQFMIEEQFERGLAEKLGPRFSDAIEQSRAVLGQRSESTPSELRGLRRAAQSLVAGLAERPEDDHAVELLAEIIGTEAELEEEISGFRQRLHEDAVEDLGPLGGEASYSAADLEAYLRERLDAPELRVTGRELLPGGRSKETTIVDLHGSSPLPPQVVLRKDQPIALVETSVVDEYAIISAVEGAGGVPVPHPYLAEADDTVLGGTFMIVDRVDGTRLGDFFAEMSPAPDRPEAVGRSIARVMARLHTIELDRLGDTCLDLEPDVRAQLEVTIAETSTRFASVTDGPPAIELELAGTWLLANTDRGLGVPALVHRDLGFGNLMARDAEVVAVIDWELASIEPPASDLGYIQHLIEPLMAWDDFVAEYLAAGGPAEACDPRAVEYWSILTYFRATEACYFAGHIFRSGLVDDLAIANAGYDAQHLGNRLLASTLARAIGRT